MSVSKLTSQVRKSRAEGVEDHKCIYLFLAKTNPMCIHVPFLASMSIKLFLEHGHDKSGFHRMNATGELLLFVCFVCCCYFDFCLFCLVAVVWGVFCSLFFFFKRDICVSPCVKIHFFQGITQTIDRRLPQKEVTV